ncbi:hypothetical protein L484_006688 [Morus notabilis]|uniref:Uncharacterized protein n=1 Tax=Morus notabilis TaxID=981085 RepID=W9SB73_9ROSA|nr:hypothetical protein L484_006688 [Morus notabilis]
MALNVIEPKQSSGRGIAIPVCVSGGLRREMDLDEACVHALRTGSLGSYMTRVFKIDDIAQGGRSPCDDIALGNELL